MVAKSHACYASGIAKTIEGIKGSKDDLSCLARAHRSDKRRNQMRVLFPSARFHAAAHIHGIRPHRTHDLFHVCGMESSGKNEREFRIQPPKFPNQLEIRLHPSPAESPGNMSIDQKIGCRKPLEL